MPSSSERTAPGIAAALVEKVEELSLLRTLNDRLAGAGGFESACRALVDLVWEERRADAVAYLSLDATRGLGRLEAVAPGGVVPFGPVELSLAAQPLATLLAANEPVVLDAPPWLTGAGARPSRGVAVSAPMRVREATTGMLVSYYCGGRIADLEEDGRLLAIVAASAALALDAARTPVREEFLAALRHDINNPLQVAIGSAEMIIDRLHAAGDMQSLARVGSLLASLEVVADLVSNHLSMAAIDRGVPLLACESVALRDLITEVVERFRPMATDKGLVLACGGAAVRVRADPRQLGRVFANLVSNAVKYTPAPGRVSVSVERDASGPLVTVADTGYGLSPDDLRELGAKYARFHRDKDIPGTGLGLYISRAIVEAHGGVLAAASAPGEGSTFTVRLPDVPRDPSG